MLNLKPLLNKHLICKALCGALKAPLWARAYTSLKGLSPWRPQAAREPRRAHMARNITKRDVGNIEVYYSYLLLVLMSQIKYSYFIYINMHLSLTVSYFRKKYRIINSINSVLIYITSETY